MDNFFIEFRDPLFSIIIFFAIIFMITFLSYWWGRYKTKEDSKHLDEFLRQFRALPSKNELKILISSGELSKKAWLLLAASYVKSGDFEKAIEIYQEMLKSSNGVSKKETLFLLGKVYFKAGFLERSKKIFLEILKNAPRTPLALRYLLLVYESMRDYKAALEVLEPLEALNSEIAKDEAYLKSLSLLNSSSLSALQKADKLLEIYQNSYRLTYLTFEFLFRVNPKLAWENFDSSRSELLTDVLWSLDSKDLNLDIIAKNSHLRELYSARGDVDLARESSTFEFNVLMNLKPESVNATLNFEYVCSACKQRYPFPFNRCTGCHEIDSLKVEWRLTKDYRKDFSKEYNSFQ